MKKTITLAALLAILAAPAVAQPIAVDSGSQAQALAGVGDINVNLPASQPLQGVIYGGGYTVSGTQTLKTTGQAILPAFSVSSGGFNCSGTAGLAVGGTGFAVSGGTSKEMDGCLALNAAVLYGQKGDAQMFDAVMCELAPVKAARKKLGFDCDTLQPVQRPVSAAPSSGAVTADNTADPFIRARLSR